MATTTDPIVHLLALRRAEKAASLQGQGYDVQADADIDGQNADLLAHKDGDTVVYEFKMAGQAQPTSEDIKRMREAALARGFDFRLIIVQPLKTPTIEVEDLPSILSGVIADQRPVELYSRVPNVEIERVTDVSVASIEVHKDAFEVSGRAILELWLKRVTDNETKELLKSFENLPFTFRVTLNHDMRVASIQELKVDTSDLDE